jgi:hypothetical protein
MATTTVLSDTCPGNVQTDVKFGFIRRVYFNAAIGATGAITVTAAATSGGITATRTSAGLYALANLPITGGIRVLASGGSIINNDSSPDVAGGRIVTWSDISLALGTANVIVTAGDDGDVSDSADGTTLSAFLDIQCGT